MNTAAASYSFFFILSLENFLNIKFWSKENIADLHWATEQEALMLDQFLPQQNSKRETFVSCHQLWHILRTVESLRGVGREAKQLCLHEKGDKTLPMKNSGEATPQLVPWWCWTWTSMLATSWFHKMGRGGLTKRKSERMLYLKCLPSENMNLNMRKKRQ